MTNRASRRASRKSSRGVPGYHRLTVDDRINAMCKNGITPQDLEKEFERGRLDGFKTAAEPMLKTCYAAICLALNDVHGFGAKRCFDVLVAVDDYVANSLTSAEAIEEVFDRMGLELDFGSPEGHIMRRNI